ncbi:D-alanyl-D-alanine carboxypeptidase family protein [Streptomyces sp. IBSNAI002]|uniref:D-alanyl-D-alanine carboxypeptidase family protein n=1 Tax=Streptomyces sp. IBSNAI002 TaxID=3457500 RepID=UPI003FD213BE
MDLRDQERSAETTLTMPLPPYASLALLAELTNTPPPPPSLLRTIRRRVRIWSPVVALLCLLVAIAQAVRPLPQPTLHLTSGRSFTFPGEPPALSWPAGGQASVAVLGQGTVGSHGGGTPVPVSSVASAMTAYVVFRDHPFGKSEDGAPISVDGAEQGTVRDALAALLVGSSETAGGVLARWHSGSEEAFVAEMNRTAAELGMADTTYTDPSGRGLGNVSTAEDQVRLGLRFVESPVLRDITVLPNWEDRSGRSWQNRNQLVPFNGAVGIKLGTSPEAGGNLLFASVRRVGGADRIVVGAVLAQHAVPIGDVVTAAAKKIMLEVHGLLTVRTVVEEGAVVGHVDDRLGGRTAVVAAEEVTVVGWPAHRVAVTLSGPDGGVPHEAAPGTAVGRLAVGGAGSGGAEPGTGPGTGGAAVVVRDALAAPGLLDKLGRLW